VIGVFSLSHGKLATYILPALPPLAIVTARTADGASSPAYRRLAAIGLVALMALFVAAPTIASNADRGHLSILGTALRPYLPIFPATVALLAVWWWRRGLASAIALVPPIAIAMGLLFYVRLAPAVSRMVSEQAMAALIARHPDAPIVSFDVTPASLMFYVPRPIVRVSRAGPLRRALAEHDGFTWIVTSRQHVDELARVATVYPWLTTGRHVLYATAPPADVASAGGEHVNN
jgi:4-amino-4-deoxy-L-arabinose transferase-like glycosyltransferase